MEPTPEALAYAELFRTFLWEGCAPSLCSIVGSLATIKVVRGIFRGLD
jgi:hypothetical protein